MNAHGRRRRHLTIRGSSIAASLVTMEEALDQFYFAHQVWSRTFSAMALLAQVIAAVSVNGMRRANRLVPGPEAAEAQAADRFLHR